MKKSLNTAYRLVFNERTGQIVAVSEIAKGRGKSTGTTKSGHVRSVIAFTALTLAMLVTTCTAQAHLAGALGIPTLLLLGPKNDARWGMGTQTAFYPMMQIIRCSRAWQWDDGIDQVLSHIEAQRHAKRPWTAFTV